MSAFPGDTSIDSVVYRYVVKGDEYDKGHFAVHQQLRTHGAVDVAFFSMNHSRGQDYFLVVANSYSQGETIFNVKREEKMVEVGDTARDTWSHRMFVFNRSRGREAVRRQLGRLQVDRRVLRRFPELETGWSVNMDCIFGTT